MWLQGTGLELGGLKASKMGLSCSSGTPKAMGSTCTALLYGPREADFTGIALNCIVSSAFSCPWEQWEVFFINIFI